MATQNRNRSQDDREEEMVDDTGRRHDSRGRFVSEEGEGESGRSRSGGGGRPQGGASRRSGGGSGEQSTARAISRAVRVLNEIETRIHELREELEEQESAGSRGGGSSSRSRRGSERDEDDDVVPGARGRVKNPESDGRLKANRDDRDEEGEEDEEGQAERPTNGRGRSERATAGSSSGRGSRRNSEGDDD